MYTVTTNNQKQTWLKKHVVFLLWNNGLYYISVGLNLNPDKLINYDQVITYYCKTSMLLDLNL